MQKYIGLFAILLMGASTSLKAVEKTNAQKDMDVFNNPENQKIYQESPVITQLLINPATKNNHYRLNLFLTYALKCSLLPKDSPLKKEEYEKFLQKEIEPYPHAFKTEDIELFKDFLNKLQNLDAKDVIDHIVADTGASAPKLIAYELAKGFIPLALHREKREDAHYFYEKVTQYVPAEVMRKREGGQGIPSFQAANMLNMQLIKHAVEYENADTIIQDLLGAPYSITQDDMDCAFGLGFQQYFPRNYFDKDKIYRLFSNKTIKPSLQVVKQAVKDCESIWKTNCSGYIEGHVQAVDLQLDFLHYFIALRSTPEERINFDFTTTIENLNANVEKFPALGKIVTLMHNDYLLLKKIDINTKKYNYVLFGSDGKPSFYSSQ